jgi:hemicentin
MRVTASGDLMILRAQPSDAAIYTCRAVNSAGSDQAQITLEVGSVPVIRDPPRSSQVDIGSELRLPCSANGYPEPTITWSRDGRAIDSDKARIDENNRLIIYGKHGQ